MDLIQMLVNVAGKGNASVTRLVFILALVSGITGIILHLMKQASLARKGMPTQGGATLAAVFLGGLLIAIKQVLNAGAHSVGFSDVSFDDIAYVSGSTWGQGADGINAVLTALRAVGVIFAYQGLKRMKRSTVHGHTGLTASEDVGNGIVKFVVGVLLLCNPYLLDALQKTLNLFW
jgi:hypothetical protein